MADQDQLDRWRRDLSGRDPVKMLNTIPAVANSGAAEGIELLEQAGAHVPPEFWSAQIHLPHKTVTVREFRDEWLAKLRASVPYAARPGEADEAAPAAFISYSTRDRVRATQLAAALTQAQGQHVFLDHWQLGPGDRLRDRIASSVRAAGSLVLLTSKASLESHWVKEEIDIAVERSRADSRFRIVPVLLDDAVLPEHLADIVYVDWRAGTSLEAVTQAVLDRMRGRSGFSARADAFLRTAAAKNPYEERHQRAGRTLLTLVASDSAMAIDANQLWLLWELFHQVVASYVCTIKIGNLGDATRTRFEFVDRWFRSANSVELEADQIEDGLWSWSVDPSRSKRWSSSDLKRLGSTGRISFRSGCRPRTDTNPIHISDPAAMRSLLDEVVQAMEPCSQAARESFVYDLHGLVGQSGWRAVELVIGGVHSDMTLAYSPMIKAETPRGGGPGATMELWDPFFGAMKSTELYRSQLSFPWEADVDLRSDQWETLLGLA
jgi:hypothetical protein